jgi:hypothetical protein
MDDFSMEKRPLGLHIFFKTGLKIGTVLEVGLCIILVDF